MGYKLQKLFIVVLTSIVSLVALLQNGFVLQAENLDVVSNFTDTTSVFSQVNVSSGLEAYTTKYNSSDSTKKIELPYVTQNPDMPMGCEIATLSMMLKNWGINASKNDIWKRLKGYKKYWNYGETPSIAHAEIKRYDPKSNKKFSIVFPEQIVPIINEILKENGRSDLIATAVYDYTMEDLDHSISNYDAPFAIYGGAPIGSSGHVVLYLGNNTTHDPWLSYGPNRIYTRANLEYAINDGGKKDNGWHVTNHSYGFVILKKSDFEEWKKYGRSNSSNLKFGSNYSKTQAIQRKTKIKYSSKKSYKLDSLFLITGKDGKVFIAYRKKIKKKPVTYGYIPLGKTKPVYKDSQILAKEKVWKIIPKNLSSSQKKKGITYKTLLSYMNPVIQERKLKFAETQNINPTTEDLGMTTSIVLPETTDLEVPEVIEEEMLENIEEEVQEDFEEIVNEEEEPSDEVTQEISYWDIISPSYAKEQDTEKTIYVSEELRQELLQRLENYHYIEYYFSLEDTILKDEENIYYLM